MKYKQWIIGLLSCTMLAACNPSSDEQEIARAYIDFTSANYAVEEIDTVIRERVEDFVRARVSHPEENGYAGGGAVLVAQKQGKTWSIIFAGNGLPECSEVEGYAFPPKLGVTCVGNGQVVNLPRK